MKLPLWDVHVHFDCAGSRNVWVAVWVWGIFFVNSRVKEMSMCISTATNCGPRFATPIFVAAAVFCRPRQKRGWNSQPSRHFVHVGALSLWRGANFDGARATLASLCARQIALAVARCECWYRSRNRLGTLCVSDHTRCGSVLILADSLRS